MINTLPLSKIFLAVGHTTSHVYTQNVEFWIKQHYNKEPSSILHIRLRSQEEKVPGWLSVSCVEISCYWLQKSQTKTWNKIIRFVGVAANFVVWCYDQVKRIMSQYYYKSSVLSAPNRKLHQDCGKGEHTDGVGWSSLSLAIHTTLKV